MQAEIVAEKAKKDAEAAKAKADEEYAKLSAWEKTKANVNSAKSAVSNAVSSVANVWKKPKAAAPPPVKPLMDYELRRQIKIRYDDTLRTVAAQYARTEQELDSIVVDVGTVEKEDDLDLLPATLGPNQPGAVKDLRSVEWFPPLGTWIKVFPPILEAAPAPPPTTTVSLLELERSKLGGGRGAPGSAAARVRSKYEVLSGMTREHAETRTISDAVDQSNLRPRGWGAEIRRRLSATASSAGSSSPASGSAGPHPGNHLERVLGATGIHRSAANLSPVDALDVADRLVLASDDAPDPESIIIRPQRAEEVAQIIDWGLMGARVKLRMNDGVEGWMNWPGLKRPGEPEGILSEGTHGEGQIVSLLETGREKIGKLEQTVDHAAPVGAEDENKRAAPVVTEQHQLRRSPDDITTNALRKTTFSTPETGTPPPPPPPPKTGEATAPEPTPVQPTEPPPPEDRIHPGVYPTRPVLATWQERKTRGYVRLARELQDLQSKFDTAWTKQAATSFGEAALEPQVGEVWVAKMDLDMVLAGSNADGGKQVGHGAGRVERGRREAGRRPFFSGR